VRLVHVSDIHHQLDWKSKSWSSSGWQGALGRIELHAFGRLSRFADAAAAWHRILEDIEKLSVDHVIFTGDLTAMGAQEEFEAVHRTVQHLTKAGKLTVIPGNHDRYIDSPGDRHFERIFGDVIVSDLPEYADAKGYPFVKLLGTEVALVGLDSTRVPGLSQYFVGRVGKAQRDALEKILKDPRVAGRTIHVLAHHGPLNPKGKHDWGESGLIDSKPLLKILEGQEVMLHHGHSHIRSWHRAGEERPHLFGGGSSTEPGREGYWVLDVDDHQTLEAVHLLPGRMKAKH
jgi:3',5'-cyclic AMP phosphodiesterase CpdA